MLSYKLFVFFNPWLYRSKSMRGVSMLELSMSKRDGFPGEISLISLFCLFARSKTFDFGILIPLAVGGPQSALTLVRLTIAATENQRQ